VKTGHLDLEVCPARTLRPHEAPDTKPANQAQNAVNVW
jgi:hypothetical protein